MLPRLGFCWADYYRCVARPGCLQGVPAGAFSRVGCRFEGGVGQLLAMAALIGDEGWPSPRCPMLAVWARNMYCLCLGADYGFWRSAEEVCTVA